MDPGQGSSLRSAQSCAQGPSRNTNFRRSIFYEKNIIKNYLGFLDDSRNRGPNRIKIETSAGDARLFETDPDVLQLGTGFRRDGPRVQ